MYYDIKSLKRETSNFSKYCALKWTEMREHVLKEMNLD